MNNTIGQICSRFSSGDTIAAKNIHNEGKYPVYGGNGLRGYTDSYNFDGECAIIGRQGAHCGNVRYFKGKAFMTEHAIIAVANKDNNSGYLSYKLQLMNLNRYQGQSAQPGLSVKTLSNVPISMPSLKVQENVFDVLNSISNKIENNNQIISELESLAKTIYDYWFLQFEFPNEDGKPYKSSGGKLVWNEELKREIPEKWSVKRYSDIANTTTGKEDANFATENGKYAYFTCGSNILKCDEYKFDGKAILIAGNGDFNVKYYDGKFNAYQRTYVLMPDEKYIGILYQASKRKIECFKKGSNGSIVKFITKGDIDNIELTIPDDDKLFDPFNSILNFIHHNKIENFKLASLRDFLLPMLMNGQVSFKEKL